ncbi:hypothetical protein AGMMS50262_08830 [Bacteroidia bacterium]|nr:hypothetical protein AGMMS50262_08830 [Bacteroidia bacterium]
MNDFPLIGQIIVFFKLIFIKKEKLKEIKRADINASLIGAALIIAVGTAWFNIQNTYVCKTDAKTNIIFVISVCILTILFFISTIRLINLLLINISENQSADCPPSALLRCKDVIKDLLFQDRFDDVEKLIKEQIKNFTKHQDFATKFKNVTNKTELKLDAIKTDAGNSVGGRYRCVLSNPDYYKKDEVQTKSLVRYFLLFYKDAQVNRFKRIFSLPIESKNNGDVAKGKDEEQCKLFLYYIIANIIAGVDTRILIYKNGNPNFFKALDYVIAENFDADLKKTKLYFSYEKEGDTDDWALCSTDSYLINIIRNDFKARLEYQENSNNCCLKITEKRDENYKHLLRLLGIYNSTNQEIDAGTELAIVQKVLEYVNDADVCSDDDTKKHAQSLLKQWISDIPKQKNSKKA